MMDATEIMPVPPRDMRQHYHDIRQRLRNSPVQMRMANRAVTEEHNPESAPARTPSVKDGVMLRYVVMVGDAYELSSDDILTGVPTNAIVLARRLSVAVVKQWGGFGVAEVADYFGLDQSIVSKCNADLMSILCHRCISTKTPLKAILPHILDAWNGTQQARCGTTIAEIKSAVARKYGFPQAEFRSSTRSFPIVLHRQMAMALCRRLTNHSLPQIGLHFGGRDHTTILHAWWKFEPLFRSLNDQMSPDASAYEWVEALADEMTRTPLAKGKRRA